MLLIALFSLFASLLVPGRVLDYNVNGWMWVLILVASVAVLLRHPDQVSFPVWLWLPWMAYLLLRVSDWHPAELQSTIQILCPVAVGMAASAYALPPDRLAGGFGWWLRLSFYALMALFVFKVLPWTLSDVENSGYITGGIATLFFQSYFLCRYLVAGRRWSDLLCLIAAILVPVISALRGPIAGSLALCLLIVAPLSFRRRLVIGVAALLVGLVVFYMPKMQYKMFYSGHGTVADLRADNPDFNWSGRQAMWETVEDGLKEKPWLGQGSNASAAVMRQAYLTQSELHNDWLRIRYNYGRVGVILFVVTMAMQVFLAYRRGRRAPPEARVLLFAGASCFIPFAVVMFTDNILVYCQYFTAPHFLLLGYGYAAAKQAAKQPQASAAPVVSGQKQKRRTGMHTWNGRGMFRRRTARPMPRPTV